MSSTTAIERENDEKNEEAEVWVREGVAESESESENENEDSNDSDSNDNSERAGTSEGSRVALDDLDSCVVLDVWGDFAHFRLPWTSSPRRTYGIPPRTTVAGMIAGMLGLPRDSYYDLFGPDHSRIGISVERPVRRQSMGINLVTTLPTTASTGAKPGHYFGDPRQQTTFDVLVNPAYRLYIALDGGCADYLDQMEEQFRTGEAVYTPTLGLSEHLAAFEFVGRFDVDRVDQQDASNPISVRSAIPGESVDLIPHPDGRYVTERSPANMSRDNSGASDTTDSKRDSGSIAAGSSRRSDGFQLMTYDRRGGYIDIRNGVCATVGDDTVLLS